MAVGSAGGRRLPRWTFPSPSGWLISLDELVVAAYATLTVEDEDLEAGSDRVAAAGGQPLRLPGLRVGTMEGGVSHAIPGIYSADTERRRRLSCMFACRCSAR